MKALEKALGETKGYKSFPLRRDFFFNPKLTKLQLTYRQKKCEVLELPWWSNG